MGADNQAERVIDRIERIERERALREENGRLLQELALTRAQLERERVLREENGRLLQELALTRAQLECVLATIIQVYRQVRSEQEKQPLDTFRHDE